MKKIKWAMYGLALVSVLAFNVRAASKMVSSKASISFVQENKEKIKKEELPSAVNKKLDADYAGWSFVQAQKTKSKDTPPKDLYEVELKKDNQSKVVVFDKNGNVIG